MDSGDFLEKSCTHIHNLQFQVMNYQISICARHTGVYAGCFLCLFTLILYPPLVNWIISLSLFLFLILELTLSTPVLLDWWLQCLAIRHSNNYSRVITGIMAGNALILLTINIQYSIVSVPFTIVWFIVFKKIGLYYRSKRPSNWGCQYCKRPEVVTYDNV